ncbi:MAG: class I SAM-dependent methyltransferase [Gemmatimonadaceae bacterium]|jgi:SAM-dependent methyltransferase|nr:class I SAM-dependent methyltransferase [Gemmatimonadaceae bacterium]
MTTITQHAPGACVHTDDTGTVEVTAVEDGQVDVRVTLRHAVAGVPLRTRTRTPPSIIAQVARVKSAAWTVDEIERATPGSAFATELSRQLRAYVADADVAGGTIIDFGCGSGASLVHLATMYPSAAEIVGVEFNAGYVALARTRIDGLGDPRLSVRQQDDAMSLPPLPAARFLVLSAVVEHMLARERRVLLPRLWDLVEPAGWAMVTDTPHRWFPCEAHTTGLWGLNYQSDAAAIRRIAAAQRPDLPSSWESLLRAGVRGSTEGEIVACMRAGRRPRPIVERPRYPVRRRRVDVWYEGLTPGRRVWLKRCARELLHLGERVTGSLATQNVSLCVRKPGE